MKTIVATILAAAVLSACGERFFTPDDPMITDEQAAAIAIVVTPVPVVIIQTKEPAMNLNDFVKRDAVTSEATPLAVLPGVIPTATPEPTATPAPTPTPTAQDYANERIEYLTRCRHWGMENLGGIIYSEFIRLNPYDMTDLERVLWRKSLDEQVSWGDSKSWFGYFGEGNRWCRDYHTEIISEHNAHKRNAQYKDQCYAGMIVSAVELKEFFDDSAAWEIDQGQRLADNPINQYLRVLNWIEIDGIDLMNMPERPRELLIRLEEDNDSNLIDLWGSHRLPTKTHQARVGGEYREVDNVGERVEWYGIWGTFGSRECRKYYPQLFYGRWIPVDSLDRPNDEYDLPADAFGQGNRNIIMSK